MNPIVVWSMLGALIVALAYYVTRMAKQSDDDGLHDTGFALLEFGRAFPKEAIRSLHSTADRNTVFVRLYDGKAGLMRNRGNHYACHLIPPGRARVTPLADAKGFTAEFFDAPTQSGTFVFATEQDAAEVSLWLLDNHVSATPRDSDAEAQTRPAGAADRVE